MIERSQEYKRHLNMMLKTSQKIQDMITSKNLINEDLRKELKLWIILMNHQTEEIQELIKEKNKIEG